MREVHNIFTKMGKNHRHKKQLKSEKSKVQLKVKNEKTKFLPKGLNVTDTTFKIRAIVVTDQFTPRTEGELLSRKRLNLKELSTRLCHYNPNVRRDAGQELYQFVSAHPQEIVFTHLSQLLHAVCPLVVDRYRGVRKVGIKLIDLIVKCAGEVKVKPFFNVISSYSRSAMTHIDRPVQEDSLILLESLLLHIPTLVSQDADKMLPNFLALISHLKKEKLTARTLSLDLSHNMSSVVWRIKVLHLLSILLRTVVEREDETEQSDERVVRASDTNTIPLCSCMSVSEKCPVDFFNIIAVSERKDSFGENVKALVPLLYETWLEVAPSDEFSGSQESTIITIETAIVLKYVLKISCFILKLPIKEKTNDPLSKLFGTTDGQQFLASVLKRFPYSLKRGLEDDFQKLQPDFENDPKCIAENLLICYLFCSVYRQLKTKFHVLVAKKVSTFIEKCLRTKFFPQQHVKSLVAVVKEILLGNSDVWFRKHVDVSDVLNALTTFYENTTSDIDKLHAFEILSQILDRPHLKRLPRFEMWLYGLPLLLCGGSVREKVVDTLLLVAKRNEEIFHASFVKNLAEILVNLPRIKVIDCKNEMVAQLKIVWLFYYLPPMNGEVFRLIVRFVEENVRYFFRPNLINVLRLRANRKESMQVLQKLQQFSWWNSM